MRKFIAASALSVLTVGAFVIPAGAAAPVNATGSVSCTGVSGSSKFAPSLVLGGSGIPGNVNSKGAYSSCTGAGISTGSGKGNAHLASNDCMSLAGPSIDLTEVVKWKGSAKVNASTIHWTGLTTDLTKATLQTTLTGTVTSGSFTGASATEVQVAPAGQDTAFFAAACGSAKGLKGYTTVSGSLSIG